MSAAPGTEFPNPCPVCGSTDEHAEFRARSSGMGCTFCPHPSERGHGTGCCCAGRSRPVFLTGTEAAAGEFPIPPSPLEDRVAALEEVLLHPLRIIDAPEPLTEEQAARFKADFDAALRDVGHQPLRVLPSPPPLTPEQVRYLLRECVTVVKPGETLAVRVPWDTKPSQVMEYQRYVEEIVAEGYVPFRVLILAGEELAVAEASADG